MEQRIQKLLILAGDQGSQNEARDFEKITNVIIKEYLGSNQAQNSQILIPILTKVIMKIPLKQHIYAGLTAKISENMKQQAHQIVNSSLNNLQIALSQFQFYEAINLITFFSQLMNISILNSVAYMNILEDIADKLESENNSQIKKFYVSVLIRSLPNCINSLSEKLFQDLKNFMNNLENHAQNDQLFIYVNKLVNKAKPISFSQMSRLGTSFSGLEQLQIKRKLKIQPNLETLSEWNQIQYFNLNKSIEDELYRQFVEEEGKIHLYNIEQLIETFYTRNQLLGMKIYTYIKSVPLHKERFLYNQIISGLISKSLKSNHPIAEQSLLMTLVNTFSKSIEKEESQGSGLTINNLFKILQDELYQIFMKGQNLDFNSIINVANLISFIINEWKREWDWQRYIENQGSFIKRRVLLLLILQKAKILNDHFIFPQPLKQFPHYQPPQKLTNEHDYKSAEDMEVFEGFENALKGKSDANVVNEMIKNDHQYEIFLEALFRRAALSQTHLKIYMQRYANVFLGNTEHDWTLINKIRNFWKRSYQNRQMYLQLVIKKDFISYNSYVNYINQLKDKNEKEMTWIKVELNQLNNLFGNSKKSKNV